MCQDNAKNKVNFDNIMTSAPPGLDGVMDAAVSDDNAR